MERLPLSYESSKYLTEIPKDPTNIIFWDTIFYRLTKIAPHHYYMPEGHRIRLKRVAKKRIFQHILKIAQQVLTQKQFEAFSLYYDFYPRKTMDDISRILGISFWATSGRIRLAKFNVLKAILALVSSRSVKQRINMVLEETRKLRNKTTQKWRNKTGWDGRKYKEAYHEPRNFFENGQRKIQKKD